MAELTEVGGRRVIAQEVKVTVPGFEEVVIVYNLMATEAAADEFIRRMGGPGLDGKPSHEGVILEVRNWPAGEYGADPWDRGRSPSAFRAWASRAGWGLAMKAFIQDPNS